MLQHGKCQTYSPSIDQSKSRGSPKVSETEKTGKNKDTNGGDRMNDCKQILYGIK